MSIEQKLRDEIQTELETLGGMEIGSDEHKTAVDVTVKQIDRYIELKKLETEAREKKESREIETRLKNEQMKQDKKLAIAKIVVEVAVTGLQIVVYVGALNKTLKFEETGTVTTSFGKAAISSLSKIFRR
jgi:DNA replication protein DnaC